MGVLAVQETNADLLCRGGKEIFVSGKIRNVRVCPAGKCPQLQAFGCCASKLETQVRPIESGRAGRKTAKLNSIQAAFGQNSEAAQPENLDNRERPERS